MTEGCSCTIFGATSKSSVCRQKTLPVYLWQNLNNQRTHNRGIGYMYELQIGCQIFTQCFLGRPDEVNSSSLTLPKNISYLRKSFGCSVQNLNHEIPTRCPGFSGEQLIPVTPCTLKDTNACSERHALLSLTSSMEQIQSLGVNSRSADQEVPYLSQNANVHYAIHRGPNVDDSILI